MRVRLTGLAGVIAIAALLAGAAPASATAGDASAHGASLNVTLLGKPAVNAGPFAAANANEQMQNTFAGVDLTGMLQTGVINASASRDDESGGVYPRASTADVRVVGALAVTGADVTWWVVAGIVLMLAGAFLLHSSRKKRCAVPAKTRPDRAG